MDLWRLLTDHGDAVIAVTVVAGVFIALQFRRGAPTDLLFLAGLVVVTVTGVITPAQAVAGFSNTAVLTIGGLLVVATALRSTGVLDWFGQWLLGSVHSERGAYWRLTAVVTSVSVVLINTALVAMFMPVVLDWCRKRRISPSRLLLPLSYLAILGGVCSLIGTSTTLVAAGKVEQQHAKLVAQSQDESLPLEERERLERFAAHAEGMGLFEIGKVGLPCALVGAAFLLIVGPRLLPQRTDMIEQLGDQRREYLVEMQVRPECRLIGKTVEEAGLRHLPGLFLIEIERGSDITTPVAPEDRVQAFDRLVFTGVVSTIVDLEKIPGLVPAVDSTYEVTPGARQQRHLTEVVLSRTSPLIGTTVKAANFRQRYNAAVVAVHRNGVRLTNKIGSIKLEPGDTLLLQTRAGFVSTYRNSRDFYLVSSVEGDEPRRHDRALIAAGIGALLILWMILTNFLRNSGIAPGLGSPAIAAIGGAALMILLRCVRTVDARNALDLQVLFTIAGAIGLGTALTESGAAQGIATALVGLCQNNPYLVLVVVYLLTVVFTEMITNNAVAAMLLPLAIAVAWEGDYNPRPYIMAITLAASLSFLTPIGYQTNLMVMGPGGYRPRDYLRLGAPLAAIVHDHGSGGDSPCVAAHAWSLAERTDAPMRPDKFQVAVVIGILLLLIGLQLRAVESFVLSPGATNTLAQWFGPSRDTPEGAVQQIVIDTTAPRKVLTPPRWLGWMCLSLGVVAVGYGTLGRYRK